MCVVETGLVCALSQLPMSRSLVSGADRLENMSASQLVAVARCNRALQREFSDVRWHRYCYGSAMLSRMPI